MKFSNGMEIDGNKRIDLGQCLILGCTRPLREGSGSCLCSSCYEQADRLKKEEAAKQPA